MTSWMKTTATKEEANVEEEEEQPTATKEEEDIYLTPQEHERALKGAYRGLAMLGLWQLKYVPYQYKTQETCDKAVCVDPWLLGDVPDNLKTQVMRSEAFWQCVPDQYVTRGMNNEVVCGRPRLLKYMANWFVTQEDIDL